MASRLWSVVFDANDRVALARFWAAALEWEHTEDEGCSTITGGDGTLQRLEFVTSPNEKRSANWLHFDLSSASNEDRDATAERLIGLGARYIDIGQEPDGVVLADPEGNEFCILEPGNSFVDNGSRLGALSCNQGSPAVGYFWSEVLGWPLVWDQDDETAVRSRDGGVFFTFGGTPEAPKQSKNRLHVDIAPPADGDQFAEVERLISLGATRVDIGQGDAGWVVLADPDGNELCVLTPR